MRLWSLHPKYLDAKGLVALWREALLARAALRAARPGTSADTAPHKGKTRGYTRHPQLDRFKAASDPVTAIECYLAAVYTEAVRRGYRFDPSKVRTAVRCGTLPVTRGQLEFEQAHLMRKLARRAPDACRALRAVKRLAAHPLFRVVPGPVEAWEKGAGS
jgi:hypothetical protein